jgi:hypothetical protein
MSTCAVGPPGSAASSRGDVQRMRGTDRSGAPARTLATQAASGPRDAIAGQAARRKSTLRSSNQGRWLSLATSALSVARALEPSSVDQGPPHRHRRGRRAGLELSRCGDHPGGRWRDRPPVAPVPVGGGWARYFFASGSVGLPGGSAVGGVPSSRVRLATRSTSRSTSASKAGSTFPCRSARSSTPPRTSM